MCLNWDKGNISASLSRDGIPEVQYNDVLRVTGLFLTKTNVWVLCWSNDNQFSNLTATAVRFI